MICFAPKRYVLMQLFILLLFLIKECKFASVMSSVLLQLMILCALAVCEVYALVVCNILKNILFVRLHWFNSTNITIHHLF